MVEELLSTLRHEGVRIWFENGRLHYQAPKGVLTPDRLSEIRARQQEIAAFLAQSGAVGSEAPPLTVVPREAAMALSFAQERLWFLDQLGLVGPAYNMSAAFRLEGALDVAALEQSFAEIVRRHESLRTRVTALDGNGTQVIDPPGSFHLAVTDLAELVGQEQDAEVRRLTRQDAERPFDLAADALLRVTLLRLAADRHVLIVTMHHIVSDGWSVNVLIRELNSLYAAHVDAAHLAGRRSPLPDLPIQYADYAVWQRSWLSGDALDRHIAWWTQRLAGAPAALDLPTDRPRPAVPSFKGATHAFSLPKSLSSALLALSRQEEATPFMVVLAAFQLLLSRWSGEDDIVVGSPIAGRRRPELEGLIGFFANMLVLRTDLSGDPSFHTLLRRVKESALGAYAHQDLPFEKLVEALHPVRDLARHPLFQVMVTLQDEPDEFRLPGLTAARINDGYTTAQFDLSLFMHETPAGLQGSIQYATDLFDAATIVRLGEHFVRLLDGIVADPDRPICDLPLLGEAERHRVVSDFNDTAIDYRQDECLHELFAAQAARTPDAVAVVDGDERLSYAALDQRANQLAHHLRKLGVGPDVVVGIIAERSLALVVGLLGILKAGGAYLPLDPDYPSERLAYMLGTARAPVLLAQAHLVDRLPSHDAKLLRLDADWEAISQEPETAVSAATEPDHLAYVIYTSGSTGRPKGVMNGHRGIVNRILWMQDAYHLSAADRVLQKTPFSFDVSVWEFFWPLLFGARLVMARPGGHQDPAYLAALIEREGVSIMHFVPSMLQAFLDVADLGLCGSLRDVMCSGEALAVETQNRFLAGLPDTRLHNLYGPTEAAVDVSAWACAATPTATQVPIGRPISNIQLYVLDRWFEPAPIGVSGELFIGGIGLARGYAGRADLTAERFVPSPFAVGERLYRTGDLARWRADGALEFLGRLDHQVKLRGLRIELGEIEAALLAHPGVTHAAVLAREDAADAAGRRLVGYVVGREGVAPEIGELRRHLQRTLPDYMVPSAFVMLAALPLTASGKLDRKALPAPERGAEREAYVAPRTAAERTLAQIFAEVLKLERVGMTDNFFALGGDSIQSIQVVARARTQGIDVTPRQVFEHQTVAGLAAVTGAAPVITAEQGLVHGQAPLTPIQRWFFDQDLPQAHHFNQALLLACENLSPALLGEALDHVVAHHDALRLRFHHGASGWLQQHVDQGGPVSVEHIDLAKVCAPEQQSALERTADRLHASLDISDGPVLRVALFELGEHSQRLLLIAHHLVVDGVSWRILVEDLHSAYDQLARGAAVRLPSKTASFKSWAEQLAVYARSTEVQQELAWWRAQPRDTVGRLPIDHAGTNDVASAAIVSVTLNAADTHALLHEVPGVYRTQINDVLLTALVEAFAGWTGRRTLLADLEGHGREDVLGMDVSRTVGWFTSLFPVLLDTNAASDPGEALKIIKEQLRAIPRRGIGYGLLRYMSGAAVPAPAAEVSFNYFGQLDHGLDVPFRFVPEASGRAHSPNNRRPHLIDVNASVSEGTLRLDWTFATTIHATETVATLAEGFVTQLQMLIGHCRTSKGGFTPSDFPHARITQRELDRIVSLAGGVAAVEDIYPLSPMQQGILFHGLYEPQSTVYITTVSCRLSGPLDADALECAWQSVVDRHAVLRTVFIATGREQPLQVVLRRATLRLERLDWRDIPRAEHGARLSELQHADRARGFDLMDPPLMRLHLVRTGQEEYRLIWTSHHVLLDGWSVPVLMNEVFSAYDAAIMDEAPKLVPARPYRDYISWLQRQDADAAGAYWRARLSGFATPTSLGIERPQAAAGEGDRYAECDHTVAVDVAALGAFARENRLTVNTLLQGAWALLLSRYGGTDDVVFGITISGRPAEVPGIERIVGLCINTLPLRIAIDDAASVIDWLRQIQSLQAELVEHQYSSLAQVQRWSDVPSDTPLFDTILAFENFPVEMSDAASHAIRVDEARPIERTHYPLTLRIANEQNLSLRLIYDTGRFAPAAVMELAEHFERLLQEIVAKPTVALSELTLLGTAERRRLLQDWNGTSALYRTDRCMHALFTACEARTPDAVAVVFGDEQVTYSELDRRTNQLAHHLQALGVGPDVVVGLCVERSVDMVVGLLGILKAGGAYLPLDPDYPRERLAFMLADARAPVLLTQDHLIERLPPHAATLLRLDADWPEITHQCEDPPELGATPDHIAYVIYTSGSTGRPKGVMIPHRGAVNLAEAQLAHLPLTDTSRVLQFASFSFDAAVWDVLMSWRSGAALVLAARHDLLPGEPLLTLLEEQGIATVLLPPSALATLPFRSLPRLTTLIVGGEACTTDMLEPWLAGRTVLNAYGPTEASVCTTMFRCTADEQVPPIGRPLPNTRVYVLDGRLEPVPVGVAGELYIGGAGLARGYLGRPATTAERFVPNPFACGERLYQTGDLVRWRADADLEFLGRIDDQVKIRGYRIELGEIEAVLRAHVGVAQAVVVAREDSDGKQLVGYVVAANGALSIGDLRAHLSARLPDYMVPSAIVLLDALPLTPNGKVDRKVLPAPDQRPELETYVPPRTPVEEAVAAIFAEVLNVDRAGLDDDFFAMGGHSLIATRVVARLRDVFAVELPLRNLFEAPTVRLLAARIEEARRQGAGVTLPPLRARPREQRMPMSYAQERLWFLDQLGLVHAAYSIPAVLRLDGVLDGAALERSFSEVVRRHENLRTRFETVDGQGVQVIDPPAPFRLEVVDLSTAGQERQEAEVQRLAREDARRPFDLAKGPLIRATLIRLSATAHVALINLHHIVSDGWSHGVLIREIGALYAAYVDGRPSPLPELTIQYADYAVWQREWLQGDELARQVGYWRDRLEGAPAALALPTDRPRPAVQSYAGATLDHWLPADLSMQLAELSRREGVSLYMVLLAAFSLLVARASGQEEAVVGSPIAGRPRQELEDLTGFFVNMLVMRSDLSGNPTFRELLQRVKETTLDAYAHQDLPFEKLVDELQPVRDLSRQPLFQVVFALQNMPLDMLALPGLQLSRVNVEHVTTKFDLTVFAHETPAGIWCLIEYATDLFDPDTIVRLGGRFERLLRAIVAAPDRPIAELPLLDDAERHRVLVAWNDTTVDYPRQSCVHEAFAEQAACTPDAVAVVHEDRELTYAELDRRANQLAHHLRGLGVGTDAVVGLCVERSLDTIVGLLGIMKAGGAYLPLDPEYPRERLAYMLSDAGVSVLLTQDHLAARLPVQETAVVRLDADWPRIAQAEATPPASGAGPDNLVYVMYTSGSTGRPKGVSVTHRNVVRLVKGANYVELTSDDVFLHLAPLAFDASTFEIFGALLNGAKLVLYPERLIDIFRLGQVIAEARVTTMWLTAGLFHQVVDENFAALAPLRNLLAGGDVLSVAHVRKVVEGLPRCRLINGYGPTEGTTFSACCTVSDANGFDSIPIGRPLSNTCTYVLDSAFEPVPIGTPGELYIGGDGLARGYLQRPAMTAERFLPSPFEVGGRLYRTGDLVRWRPDGNLEFFGRIDSQVKIRGHRIEPGEIESVLSSLPGVEQAAVVAREDTPGDKRLVAYVVPDIASLKAQQPDAGGQEQVAQWETLFDETYDAGDHGPSFVGWNSSYTGAPIPQQEMQEWLTTTIERIAAQRPERILEVGCGVGLLLQHLAPNARIYHGTDVSGAAIARLRGWLRARDGFSHVLLAQREAIDWQDVERGAFDTVIVNSVVQYFPDIDHLRRVLDQAIEAVGPIGRVFIGDVRHLGLLPVFHASVQLAQAPVELSVGELRSRIARVIAQDQELVIDPDFFHALQQHDPRIAATTILVKRGRADNELTRYRYDVVLQVGEGLVPDSDVVGWDTLGSPVALAAQLRRRPAALRITGVPNRRLARDLAAARMINASDERRSVADLRAALRDAAVTGEDPEALWELGEAHGYDVHIGWTTGSRDGRFDMLLVDPARAARASARPVQAVQRPWHAYANDPGAAVLTQHFGTQLREQLHARLPDYMVPSAFVVLDELPLTANGKVDRRALPPPEERREVGTYVAPRTAAEETLAAIWREVLKLDRVGIDDNFFELGGDSIQSIQVVARANRAGLRLTVRQMFDHQTIAGLAAVAGTERALTAEQGPVRGEAPLTPIQSWFFAQHRPEPHHFNQALLLACEDLSAVLLGEALDLLATHHDALRLRFRREGPGWVQRHVDESEPIVVESIDLAGLATAVQDEALASAADQLQSSLDIANGPMLRAALFDLGERGQRLLLIIHHLVVDGVSWRILLEDLHDAYKQRTQREPVQLPAKTTSFKQWAEQLAAYARSGDAQRGLAWWQAQPWDKAGRLPVDHAGGANDVTSAATVSVSLSVADTRALLQEVPAVYRTQVNDVLLTALVEAFAGWTGRRSLLIDLEGHGREDLFAGVDLSRTVGWFTSLYPMLLDVSAASDPGEALNTIKEQLRAVPRRGIGYGVLRYLSDVETGLPEPAPEVSFNYFGQVDPGLHTPFRLAPEASGRMQSPADRRPHLIDISGSVVEGQLHLHWIYGTAIHNADTITTLAENFVAQLQRLIAYCRTSRGGFTPSDFPQVAIGQRELDRIVDAAGGAGAVEDIYPLSPVQQGMLFHCLYEPESTVYITTVSCRLCGPLDVEALERAWTIVVERHATLRTAFVGSEREQPLQVVLRSAVLPFEQHDWRDSAPADHEQKLIAVEQADRARGFDLTKPPLMRLHLIRTGETEHRLIWTSHHLLFDGWSVPILMNEMFCAYGAATRREAPTLAAVRPYRDYIAWLQRQDMGSAEAYWRARLAGFETPTSLGVERTPAGQADGGDHYAAYQYAFPTDVVALDAFARRHRVTVNTLVQGAWALLLSRYSGSDDVVFGVTISGRPAELPQVEQTVGLFINTLPLRIAVMPAQSVADWLRDVHVRQTELVEHQYSPLAQVQRWSEVPAGTPLFDSIVVFENYPSDLSNAAGMTRTIAIDDVRAVERTNYPLTLELAIGQKLSLKLIYDTERFEASVIAQMTRHLAHLLEGIVSAADGRLSELSLLGGEERQQLVADFNDTAIGYRQDVCLHDLFAAQAARTPDAVAVVDGDERLSYAALDQRANQLAHHLRKLGVGPDVVVGIIAERSLALVVGLIGILKAGGAYLPLDPDYPSERLAYMLGTARAPVLLAQAHLLDRLPSHDAKVLRLDADWEAISQEPGTAVCAATEPDHLAYVIYTSGSTGRPKGVMNAHRGIVNRILWMQDAYRLSAADRVLQKTPFSFDVSVWEFFWPLLLGARLVMARPGGHQDPAYLAALIEREGVSIMHFVPSMLQAFLDVADLRLCGSLRDVMCSGEALAVETQNRFLAGLPGTRLHNLYGPTEAAVDVSAWPCAATPSASQVPIGRPISNIKLYVLDRWLEPAPIGVAGELFIGGIGLARGYAGRAELTAERFVPSPFVSGERLYRTGDLARWRPDGALEFLGRLDHQVKLRGLRIELGEIEAALLAHPGVTHAAVLAREDAAGRRLVGYVVGREGVAPEIGELRRHLQRTLPDYMVPSAFVMLAALPLTASGKLDRKALPAPEQRPDSEAYVAPRTAAEAALAGIFAEVLKLERVGMTDNFFALGGDSIQSIQVVARARTQGIDVTPRQIFEQQTVAALADLVGTAPAIAAEQGRVAGEVPLTPIQHWFFAQELPQPHHFNQAVLLACRDQSAARLGQALTAVVAHHDALRLRFGRAPSGWRQWHASDEPLVTVETIDLGAFDPSEQDAALTGAADRLQAGLDLADGPLLRAALFELGARGQRLLLVIHHLVVDGVSWRILLEDLHSACDQLARGEPVRLPAKTTSYKHWAERLAAEGSAVVQDELAWWQAQPWDTVGRLPRDHANGGNEVASAGTVTVALSAAETEALLQEVPGVYRTQINDVLLTCLVEAFADWTGRRRLLVDLEGHGREDLFVGVDLSRTVGWFTGVFPVLLDVSEAHDPGEALKSVKEQLRAVPRHGVGYGILRHLGASSAVPASAAEVSFNYLGRLDDAVTDGPFRFAREGAGLTQDPHGQRPHAIAVNAVVIDGCLQVHWGFGRALHEAATITALADSFVGSLRDLIAHCRTSEGGFTPSDFPLLNADLGF